MSERRIQTRCVCGWVSSGDVEAVVEATIEHGRRMHNMVATREQVLEQAEVLDAGDVPAAEVAADATGTADR